MAATTKKKTRKERLKDGENPFTILFQEIDELKFLIDKSLKNLNPKK